MTNEKILRLRQQRNEELQEWMNRENPKICVDGIYGYVAGVYLSHHNPGYEIRAVSFDGKYYNHCNFQNLDDFLNLCDMEIIKTKLFKIALE